MGFVASMIKNMILSAMMMSNITNVSLVDAQTISIGGSYDDHHCMIGAGYSWCAASNSCIRMWETPCEDYFDGCPDCLKKQRLGQNIACPRICDSLVDPTAVPIMVVDPMPPTPMHPVDPMYPPPPTPPPPMPCSDVMCMMYCENGFLTDVNGCNVCVCSVIPMAIDYELPDVQPPTPDECPIPINPCTNLHVCPKVVEITHCSRNGISGYTTYQLSLIIQNMHIQNIYAIYGDDQFGDRPMNIPPAYQGVNIFNSNIGGLATELIAINPDAAFDSWLTIGLTNGDANNKLSSVGIDFSSWTETQGIHTTDGAIFLMDANEVIVNGREYVIAQLTVPDNYVGDITLNAQGSLSCDKCSGSPTWNEQGILFHLSKPAIVDPNVIPTHCASWFDGCNTCNVHNGILGGCTRIMCFREDTPHCLSFNNQNNGH